MSSQTLTFALFGNVYQHEKSVAVRDVLLCLRDRGARIMIEEEYYDFLCCSELLSTDELTRQLGLVGPSTSVSTFSGDDFEADFALSMGGDGTLLKTASLVGARQTPILGFNMGRLGFLADAGARDVEATIDALYRGDYRVEDRALILVETNGNGGAVIDGSPCALNDVAILKRDTASMISIRTSINGEYLTTYQADGLVVSTPTGSTAYSLSNGGPIIVPRTGVFLLTAVAPHSLNVRPIVIPDNAVVELNVSSRSHTFLVAIDGRSTKMPEGTAIRLSRAPYVARVVKRASANFFSTLREKMMWGADGRQ
ncbi:MAG: NAD kinase [Prevotella sp.]|nr:NAD kinase [Prevotella sp.]